MITTNGQSKKPDRSLQEVIDDLLITPEIVQSMPIEDAKHEILEQIDSKMFEDGLADARAMISNDDHGEKKKEPFLDVLLSPFNNYNAEALGSLRTNLTFSDFKPGLLSLIIYVLIMLMISIWSVF